MEYVKLGNTGLDVSQLCLSCMGFGEAENWIHPWVINEEQSRAISKKHLSMVLIFSTRQMCIPWEPVKNF